MSVITVRAAYYSDIASLFDYVGDYTNVTQDFGPGSVTYDVWTFDGSTGGPAVTFRGSGFTYDGAFRPTGGAVSSLELRTDNGAVLAVDITGLVVSFPTLYAAFRSSAADMFALFGDIAFVGGRGIDRISLSSGKDDIRLFGGDDIAWGGAGNDYINGGSGFDMISGDAGNDTLDGGTGADRMVGGLGKDRFYVDDAKDLVVEAVGGGSDYVLASVSYGLKAGVEVEKLSTTNTGASASISLTGNEFAQQILGNQAGNKLSGLAGNDQLFGYGGNDALYGGQGADKLTGGPGNDNFIFDTALNAKTNLDTIADFANASGDNDTIRLDDAIFATLALGKLAAGAFMANTTGLATQADDRIIYEADTGKLFYDSNGSASGGAVQFAALANKAALTAADFLVI